MYVGDDTRTMTFVLREVMHLHTEKLPARSTVDPPGHLWRITASPLSAMLKKVGAHYMTNTLGFSASRWREIKYVGTRVQLVPLATTGRIDPADIAQASNAVPGPGTFSSEGSIHPYDALNFVHWRRWTGGNINLPAWHNTATSDDSYVDLSLAYDQEWLSDDRFNHCKLTDGLQFDSVPLRVDLETSALAGNSLFGFSSPMMMSASRGAVDMLRNQADKDSALADAPNWAIGLPGTQNNPSNYYFDADLDKYFQPGGLLLPSAGKDYHEQGWLPNPFAGFIYELPTGTTKITPGDESFQITGYINEFPWFADRTSLAPNAFSYVAGGGTLTTKWAATLPFDLEYLVKLCIERFISPVGIVRLPPAYGTMFFWTCYMAHIFQLRKPFLANSAWVAARVDDMGHDITPIAQLAGDETDDDVVNPMLVPHGSPRIFQAIGPDPYGITESPSTLSLADLAPHIAQHPEPRRIVMRDEKNGNIEETEGAGEETGTETV